MATLTIGQATADYQWLPDLMPDPASTVSTRWVNYRGDDVSFTTTGASWAHGVPTNGQITSLSITLAGSTPLVTLATFTNLSADLVVFWYEAFGYPTGNGGSVAGSAINALSVLLMGDDVIIGSGHADEIYEGAGLGNDLIQTGAGDDYIWGLRGNDTIDGGADLDTLTYEETFYSITAYRGVVINMLLGQADDPWGGVDRFSGIEQFRGTGFNDVFIGDAADNIFHGYRGADKYTGGGGFDLVAYWRDSRFGATHGIYANLAQNTVIDGFGQRDRVIDIDRIDATEFDDTLKGGTRDDIFAGGPGKDAYDGRVGFDTVSFSWSGQSQTGTVINLAALSRQVANDGFGNVETLISIEGVIGNQLGDSITGNAGNNRLEGGRGNDTLSGGDGLDWIQGDHGADLLTGGRQADTFAYAGKQDPDPWGDTITDFVSGTDVLRFETSDFAGMDMVVRFRNAASAGGNGSWFYFQNSTDGLFWDADGRGAGAAVLVATLTGVSALSANDFLLI